MSASPQPSVYIEGILLQVLRMKNAFPQSHMETAFRMVSGLYSALLIRGNEVPGISKLIKHSLIQVLTLEFYGLFFIVTSSLHITLSLCL